MHLFRVARGLESAILGETEIQGQVKEAHRVALEAKAVGPILDRLASRRSRPGKRARTDTGLGRGAISHGQAAYEVVRRVFGGLKQRTVLVVGAGEMATRAATALAALPADATSSRTARAAAGEASRGPAGGDAPSALEDAPSACARRTSRSSRAAATPLSRAACEARGRRRDPLLRARLRRAALRRPAVGRDLRRVPLRPRGDRAMWRRGSRAGARPCPPPRRSSTRSSTAFRAWHRTRRAAPAIRSLHAWAEEIRASELRAPARDGLAARCATPSRT